MDQTPTAAFYDSLTADQPHRELPDDPRPLEETAIAARTRAQREGRLVSVPRDELNAKPRPVDPMQKLQAEVAHLRRENATMATALEKLGADYQKALDALTPEAREALLNPAPAETQPT